MSKSNNDYAHELSAFCAAIRSSIDFLVRLMAMHTKSIQVDSIATYLGMAGEGRTGPTVDVVAKHAKWLRHLRDYRDYLIHGLVINTTSGQQRVFKDGAWANTAYPVVLPSETPKHAPDTRRARMMDEPEHRFVYSTREAWHTDEKGHKRIIEHSVEITPQAGDMRIEDLMDRELKAFEAFFCDLMDVLLALNFGPAHITRSPKP
jgi:hypothetical protein